MHCKALRNLILPLVVLACLSCGHEREQQQNLLKDMVSMQQAMVAQQEIPAPSEDQERYGKGDALIRYMYDRFLKVSALNQEFLALVKETELWTSPAEWKDRQKVKVLRKKAERLVAVVDEYTEVIDETIGEKGLEKIHSFKLGSSFNRSYGIGLQEAAEMLGELNTLMTTTRNWAQKMAELLALVDEKLVKMDGKIPKFEQIEEAERYRRLNYQIQEEKHLLGEQALRYMKQNEEYQKGVNEKVQRATES